MGMLYTDNCDNCDKAIVMKYSVLRPRAGTFWEKMPEKNKHRRILSDRKKVIRYRFYGFFSQDLNRGHSWLEL